MRPRAVRRTAGAVAVALAVGTSVAACGGSDEADTLRILAAASLTDVFTELGTEFEAQHPEVDVELSFGSSTDLAEQAADGAPGDVLATADATSMQIAEEAGVVTDPTTFATNVLALVTPPDNPADVTALDDLAGTTWVRCADEAPCGKVAAAVLADAGVDAEPVSLEEDVRATLDKVTSGEAEAALVYASDAAAAGDAVATFPIEGVEDRETSYFVATLEGADGAAQDWVDLVTGDAGRRVLGEAGFTLP